MISCQNIKILGITKNKMRMKKKKRKEKKKELM